MKKLEATRLITCGDSSRLDCKVTGSPVITFKWFKDEMEITPSPKYTMAVEDLVASLEIVQCTVEESGDYVCVASSEAGSDRCCSTVTVKGWFHVKRSSFLVTILHLFSSATAKTVERDSKIPTGDLK